MITNEQSRTRIDEVQAGIYRISTPLFGVEGGFSFNQYLVVDDEPVLFHTGPRGMFALTADAIGNVLPVEKLRYVGFSHYENDECGALNAFLDKAPHAQPLCGTINAMINGDAFDRAPRVLSDGESLGIGQRTLVWFDAPHLPHAWECGYLFEKESATLFCGDLFTQGGAEHPAVTTDDILESSEAMRKGLDYYAHAPNGGALLDKLLACRPALLACMHGSAYRGDGAALLLALKGRLRPAIVPA
ncbi:MBL fold metallo-hydrolase [Pendulispora brunnea]|uniref:MBL fold metallo-hydrolase n=1 Tax=Pendulispora brunnea TaxID=2905690 RepID=A0ABZ2KB30_9BACT